jgi:hypothetical protein
MSEDNRIVSASVEDRLAYLESRQASLKGLEYLGQLFEESLGDNPEATLTEAATMVRSMLAGLRSGDILGLMGSLMGGVPTPDAMPGMIEP